MRGAWMRPQKEDRQQLGVLEAVSSDSVEWSAYTTSLPAALQYTNHCLVPSMSMVHISCHSIYRIICDLAISLHTLYATPLGLYFV